MTRSDGSGTIPGNYDLPAPRIPWEDRRHGACGGFWKTVFYVLRRNGRIGEDVDTYVDLRAAKFFRFLVLVHATVGMFGLALLLLAPLALDRAWGLGGEEGAIALFIGGLIVAMLLLLSFWLANVVIGWFSMPGHLGNNQMESSLHLTCYLSAPLALLVFLAPSALLLVEGIGRSGPTWLPDLLGLLPLAVLVYWYQLVLSGLRDITRRGSKSMFRPGIIIAVAWVVLVAGIVTLPATAAMWLMVLVTTR